MTREWQIATLRHGETEYNYENRYAGSLDIPLNLRGRKETILASERVMAMQFDVCIVSPLKRAAETAHILTGGRIKTVSCPYARERNFGILQGLTIAEVGRIRPPIRYIKVGGDYHSIDIPGAETFEELRHRTEKFYDYILKHYKGRKILVVSHGVFLQQFHGLLRGQDWIESLEAHPRNLEVTIFRFEGNSLISSDIVHLVEREQSDF